MEVIVARGGAFLRGNQPRESEQHFAAALLRNASLPEVQNLVGVAVDQQGRHREAR
ncbi:MAG TPA: hypothetical protein VFA33_13950 [Bryobacteraceae bacterium]|nr:hypothetical protein [Bryobacteraceae bacterium]